MTRNIDRNNARCTKGLMCVIFAMAVCLAAGCEFDASGTGNGPPPQLGCGLDLESTQFYTDLEPGLSPEGDEVWGSILTQGDPTMHQTFWIGWTVHYFGNTGDPTDESDPFNTSVEIINGNDDVVWSDDLLSDPVRKGDYRTDGVVIEGGLPPGEYIVSIFLDTEGDVFECFSLPIALNNLSEYELTVVAPPIDDVVNRGGESPDQTPPQSGQLGGLQLDLGLSQLLTEGTREI